MRRKLEQDNEYTGPLIFWDFNDTNTKYYTWNIMSNEWGIDTYED